MPRLRAKAPAQPSRGTTRVSESTPSSQCCRETSALEGHMARKSLEIRLGALPAMLRSSEKMAARGRKDWLLPKLIRPGCKAPLARHQLCPSLRHQAASVEVNVRHKYMQYRWALPTLYAESLARMMSGPPAPSLPLATAVDFCHLEAPFMAHRDWELLERHVLRKRLQHEWGLPGLVRRSLGHFMPPPPAHPRAKTRVRLAARELRVSCGIPPISLASARELEAHIRRRVAERRWGLPRRVRESLRVFTRLTPTAPGPRLDTRGTRASRPLRELSGRRAPSKSATRRTLVHPTAVPVSVAGALGAAWSQQLSWDTCRQLLERHVARKNVEIRLGLIPRRAQRSQEVVRRLGKLPLPRLIRPGQRPLERRSRQLLFLEPGASNRVELNLRHKHLNFMWGLPTLYRRSLAKLFRTVPAPALPPSSTHPARTKFMDQELPFLPPGARETLERHVRKKLLQHTWGSPALIARSLRAFAPEPLRPAPVVPRFRTELHLLILKQEPPLIDQGGRGHLEQHLRKMILQRRWGLPRRIQESLRVFAALVPPAGPRLPEAGRERDTRPHQLGAKQADLPSRSRWAGTSISERGDDLQQGLPESVGAKKLE
nr:protein FAM205A-like [Pelodiscus sinensis]|eukprot:XP_025042147.1 protein FAM205A-like [Pelodiscus sinensis]